MQYNINSESASGGGLDVVSNSNTAMFGTVSQDLFIKAP
jgi:hypothetical protein